MSNYFEGMVIQAQHIINISTGGIYFFQRCLKKWANASFPVFSSLFHCIIASLKNYIPAWDQQHLKVAEGFYVFLHPPVCVVAPLMH